MIRKIDYDNADRIREDKDRFKEIAEHKGFNIIDIEEFIQDFYENLKSFQKNLIQLKKFSEGREY